MLGVGKIVIRCSLGKQITEMSWGEIVNALVTNKLSQPSELEDIWSPYQLDLVITLIARF